MPRISRHDYIAGLERKRLARLETRARERREREEVEAGVAESVNLGLSRGEAFDAPEPGKGARTRPVRRMSGLGWLAKQGRMPPDLKRIGETYGDAYRVAQGEDSIRSCIGDTNGGGSSVIRMPPSFILVRMRQRARDDLAGMRARLGNEQSLIQAMDLICGDEKTPREASKNGADAAALEALLMAALRLLQATGLARAA